LSYCCLHLGRARLLRGRAARKAERQHKEKRGQSSDAGQRQDRPSAQQSPVPTGSLRLRRQRAIEPLEEVRSMFWDWKLPKKRAKLAIAIPRPTHRDAP
jgi:hypothetical protein